MSDVTRAQVIAAAHRLDALVPGLGWYRVHMHPDDHLAVIAELRAEMVHWPPLDAALIATVHGRRISFRPADGVARGTLAAVAQVDDRVYGTVAIDGRLVCPAPDPTIPHAYGGPL